MLGDKIEVFVVLYKIPEGFLSEDNLAFAKVKENCRENLVGFIEPTKSFNFMPWYYFSY